MLRFQTAITTGLGLLFAVPAMTLQDADLATLTGALRDTERALDVLRGVETRLQDPNQNAAGLVRGVTEAAHADPVQSDAELERLRGEVGLLQAELDALDIRTHSRESVAVEVDLGGDIPQMPAAVATEPGVTTGLSPEQRAALMSGAPMPQRAPAQVSASNSGGKGPSLEPTKSGSGATKPVTATPMGGGASYSADPIKHGQALLRAGRFREGFALVSELEGPEALHLQARFLEKLGRLDEAILALEAAIQEMPAGYERRRAQSDLDFYEWKREFLQRLPEDVSGAKSTEGESR